VSVESNEILVEKDTTRIIRKNKNKIYLKNKNNTISTKYIVSKKRTQREYNRLRELN
jgi:hypothetical protein